MSGKSLPQGLQVEVHDFPIDHRPPTQEDRPIWHPLDHLNGHVVIKSPIALDVKKINIQLHGDSSTATDVFNGKFI